MGTDKGNKSLSWLPPDPKCKQKTHSEPKIRPVICHVGKTSEHLPFFNIKPGTPFGIYVVK